MDAYDHVFDTLTAAMQSMRENGITKLEMVVALADFTTAVALMAGGEEGALAVITRMEGRIEDWKAGRFLAKSRNDHSPLKFTVAGETD